VWLAVVALGLSSFVIVTTELAPIGLLSPLAAAFGQTEGDAGLLVTVYAWLAAAVALLSALFLGKQPPKRLLITLMFILSLSSVIAAQASTFSTLLGARMVGAVAHGAFWAMIGTVAVQLVPAHRVGLATSIIFGGVSVASVLGIPLANLLAHFDGFRTAFNVIAILSLLATFALIWTLPALSCSGSVGLNALSGVVKNRIFRRIYLATACAVMAHFSAFTYIEPLLSTTLHIRLNFISLLLLVFGLAGVVGNIISGKLIDRYLKSLVMLSLALMALCVALIGTLPASASAWLVGILLFGWGVAVAIMFVGFQAWILREAQEMALPASAIYVAIFNAAIGTGALIGGRILSITSLQGLMIISALAIAGSLLPIIRISPK